MPCVFVNAIVATVKTTYDSNTNTTTRHTDSIERNSWKKEEKKKRGRVKSLESRVRSTPALGVAHTTASQSPSSFAQGRLGSSKLPSRDHWCPGSHARHSKPLLSIRRRVSSKASPHATPCRLSLTTALSRAPFFLVTLIPFPQGHSHARSSKIRAGSSRLLFLVVHRRCRAIATGSLFISPYTFSLIVFNCTAESLLEHEKDVSRLV